MEVFDFVLTHAFLNVVHAIPEDEVVAARTLVRLTGDPETGLSALHEKGRFVLFKTQRHV